MVSNQQVMRSLSRTALAASATVALLMASGCQLFPGNREKPTEAAAPAPAAAPSEAPAPDNAIEVAIANAPAESAAEESAPAPAPVVNQGAPLSYTVKRGDTLWDISAMYLRDPWLWPEIWYVNPQVENPHLIYPGDELLLVYIDGKPRIMLERGADGSGGVGRLSPRVRSTPLDASAVTIPYDLFAAFMRRPTVLAKEQVDNAPYIVRTREDHLIAAEGNDAYVRRLKKAELDARYDIFRVGDKIVDPDDGDVLGYVGIFTAAGKVTRLGDPATLRLTESALETLDGNILLPTVVTINPDVVARVPTQPIDGRIIEVADAAMIIGQYQVIAINRGKRDGLETGHILGIWQVGQKVSDEVKGGKVRLPDERAGLFVTFKVYDRMSYGLVLRATSEFHAGDAVRNP